MFAFGKIANIEQAKLDIVLFFAWLVTDIGENAHCSAETPSRRKGNIELAGGAFAISESQDV